MNQSEFERNGRGAKQMASLSDAPLDQDFWAGYMRGLRRHYHGEKFGTADEHALWMSAAEQRHDEKRRYRGIGYRVGFDGQNIQQAMKTLAGHQHMSELGKLGGSSTSPRKALSSVENGRLGGRPRKSDGEKNG